MSTSTPNAGSTSGPPSSAASTARSVGQCTVLEIGDSLGNDLGWGIARHVNGSSGLNLVQDDKSSTGLVNTSFWDWPAHLRTDLGQAHPQLVLISMGGNDEQGLYVNGQPVEFPTAAWKKAYLARAESLVHEATRAGAYVLWVGMPIMQQSEFSQGMQVLNSIDAQAVASDPNARFLSVWQLFSNPSGDFQSSADVNGSSTSLRASDGVHYSYAGEDVIATYVLRHLATIFDVRLAVLSPSVITGW